MDLREAVRTVLEHTDEWTYEDRGYDYVYCSGCNASTDDVRKVPGHIGNVPPHRPGCELREALDVLEAFLEEQSGT